MKWLRMFSYDAYKGTPHYLKEQRIYEVIRTILYFTLSLGLFFMGYITTKTKTNLLTIVAVLGCLPACKSLISAIMFCRFKGLPETETEEFMKAGDTMTQLFDMVFTSYDKTFVLEHLILKGDTVIGYSTCKDFPEKAFVSHISNLLKADGITNVVFKIFTDKNAYFRRAEELMKLDTNEKATLAIEQTLKSVSL